MITQNIIGYQLCASSGKKILATEATSLQPLPEAFAVATPEEVDLAVQKAFQAWRALRRISSRQRADFLVEIANGIEALDAILIARIKQETAYPEARIIVERNRTCAQLRMFADIAVTGKWNKAIIDKALPERVPAPRPELQRRMFPIGPVVVFGASNFPLAYSTAGGDVASALAVGCPVIIKAHDAHLGTNALVAEVIMNAAKQTGMPEGIFSSLNGDGFHTAKQLVLHPRIAAVGFTGSKSGGRALFDLGQQREVPIPVFAEMGSVNPIFLLPGKVADRTRSLTTQITSSMTMTVGQFCTNPGLLIVQKSEMTNLLIEELVAELAKVESATMLNEGIRLNFQTGIQTISKENGVTMLYNQNHPDTVKFSPVLAAVDATIFLSNPKLHQEIFGPYSLLIQCDDQQQMFEVAEALEGQLTSSIHAAEGEKEDVLALMDILTEKAGRIVFNGVPTGVEVCEAMTHGGPYPASTDQRFTAVGHHAIWRWLKPVTFQNLPAGLWHENG